MGSSWEGWTADEKGLLTLTIRKKSTFWMCGCVYIWLQLQICVYAPGSLSLIDSKAQKIALKLEESTGAGVLAG